MKNAGMPLSTQSRKTFAEIDAPNHLAYSTLADFIPDVEPYHFMTTVDLQPTEGGTAVTMIVDELHDDVWTERLLAGRSNELDKLAAVVKERRT
jgi:hypothetical protein